LFWVLGEPFQGGNLCEEILTGAFPEADKGRPLPDNGWAWLTSFYQRKSCTVYSVLSIYQLIHVNHYTVILMLKSFTISQVL
jgi:hypothetical protein